MMENCIPERYLRDLSTRASALHARPVAYRLIGYSDSKALVTEVEARLLPGSAIFCAAWQLHELFPYALRGWLSSRGTAGSL